MNRRLSVGGKEGYFRGRTAKGLILVRWKIDSDHNRRFMPRLTEISPFEKVVWLDR